MAVNFASIEIARSGLFVNERGLFVTGQNISNVNTPGYVRQQAVMTTAQYVNDSKYQLGLGADIQKIRQIRHIFLDNMYRNESQSLGYWETRQKTFSDIQSIMGEPLNEGFQGVMNQYWDSWQELSKNPESLTTRALVRQRGDALVQYINHMGDQLDKMQNDLNSELKVRIDEVNTLTEKVSKLNVKILSTEVSGDTANDLRDERNLYLDRLSKLVDCDINEMQDGQIDVTVGGYFLVSKGTHERLTTVENKTGSLFSAPAMEKSGIILPVRNGIIKGLMESRGEVLGTPGSAENGCPNDKVDLIFAFNTNDTSAQRDNLANNIDSIVKCYNNKGIGVRLGYVTFNDTGMTSSTTFVTSNPNTNGVYVPDVTNFKAQINGVAFSGSGIAGVGIQALQDAENAANAADLATDWRNTSKQIILYANSGMDTNGLNSLGSQFYNNGVKTLVVSDSTQKPALDNFAKLTGDRFIESDTTSSTDIISDISESVRSSISGKSTTTNNIIPDLKSKMNTLINALVREVNSIHRSGKTLAGEKGMDFFVPVNPYYPMEMGNIQINPKLTDLNNIVSSADGSVGDNSIAVQLADLRHTPILGPTANIQNMDDFYRTIIAEIGNGGAEANRVTEGQTSLVNSADGFRQSIMNVSMDEEMSNMMKYQYAYSASARVLNVFDEMYESIVNRLGLVGR